MKVREANRMKKVLADLVKVKEALEADKAAAALKKVTSLVAKLDKAVSGVDKPKKLSEYSKFMKKHYAEVKAEHPDWDSPKIMKRVAEMWSATKPKGEKKAAAKKPKAAKKPAAKKASGEKKPRKPRAKKVAA